LLSVKIATSNAYDKLHNINADVRGRCAIKTFDRLLVQNKAILSNLKMSADIDKSCLKGANVITGIIVTMIQLLYESDKP